MATEVGILSDKKVLKRPRANSLSDGVRIFFAIEREYKEKIFSLARADDRSVFEWGRIVLREIVDARWAEHLKKKKEREALDKKLATIESELEDEDASVPAAGEPEPDPVERYT